MALALEDFFAKLIAGITYDVVDDLKTICRCLCLPGAGDGAIKIDSSGKSLS